MKFEKELYSRANKACELCSSQEALNAFPVSPYEDNSLEHSALICQTCSEQITGEKDLKPNHWHCLNQSMWSEFPPVQVLAWRQLKKLSNESWAMDLLDQFYMDEDTEKWASSGLEQASEQKPTKDSNGSILEAGDNVTLIKDLVVKGANFTAKRGTMVRNIRLTDDPEHIEGRVNGTMIVLVSKFLKKSV